MRPLHLLIVILLLSSLGCSGAGAGVAPEELSPLQRWVATKADQAQHRAGFSLEIDLQAGLARLFHDGVLTQEIAIESATDDGTVSTTASAPSD